MIWDDARIVAADLETSGEITHTDIDTGKPTSAYALQPWRLKDGKGWITSGSMIRHAGNEGLIRHFSQLFPTKEQLYRMLCDVVENNWIILGWNITFDVSWLMALGPEFEDICLRIQWLDGMLMWRHYDIEPEYEFQSARHKKKRYRLKPEAMQEWLPGVPLHNENVDFHATDPANLARLQTYNDKDNVYTWIISRMIWHKLSPVQQRAVLIEAESIPMVAQANLHGLPVDYLHIKDLSAKLDIDAADKLAELAPDGMREDIVRSPAKLAELMFDQWQLPVLKKNKSKVEGKEDSRSTDKEVLHELAFIDVRAKKVKEYREALNAKGKFCTSVLASLEHNGGTRTHPTAGIFRTYCVPGDVEVLTPEGWVALQDWTGGDIMQVSPDGWAKFLPATRFVGPQVDMWCSVDHQRLKCLFTAGHTMPYLTQAGNWRTIKAGEMVRSGIYDLPVASKVIHLEGAISPEQMRMLAATQADGYFNARGGLSFCFEKSRKIERMRQLLRAAGVVGWREQGGYATRPDRVEFHISRRYLPEWLSVERKQFGPWVLDTTQEGLVALVDEVRYWDGSAHQDGGYRYVSKIRENVEWVVTAAALVGKKASLHVLNADGMSSCHISDERPVVTVRPNRHMKAQAGVRRAYCATTQTGYWLARTPDGHIFVTGNTGRMTVDSKQGRGKTASQIGFALHQMKRGKEYREIVCAAEADAMAPEGYDIMEFDAAGQEFRWMAIASRDPTMLRLCLPGEDAHTYMGAAIVGMPYPELLRLVKAEDKVAGQNRYLGKFANLSLQYRTSARKLRSKARVDYDIPIELPEAQRIHATYQRTYPGVPQYWERQIALVKAQGYVETFGGNRVRIEGDWNGSYGWSMGSTAINYKIQGTGADQKHLAMAVIKDYLREIGGRFLFDLHDGLYLLIPTRIRQKAANEIKRRLDNLPYQQAWGFTPPIPMPWDGKVGKSWGRMKELQFD